MPEDPQAFLISVVYLRREDLAAEDFFRAMRKPPPTPFTRLVILMSALWVLLSDKAPALCSRVITRATSTTIFSVSPSKCVVSSAILTLSMPSIKLSP